MKIIQCLTLLTGVGLFGCADPFGPQKDPLQEFQSLKSDVAPHGDQLRVQNLRPSHLSTMILGEDDQAQTLVFSEGELGQTVVRADLRAGPNVSFDLELEKAPAGMTLEELQKEGERSWQISWAPPVRTVTVGLNEQQLDDVRIKIVPKPVDEKVGRLPDILTRVELVHTFSVFVRNVQETSKPSLEVKGWPTKETLNLNVPGEAKDLVIIFEVKDSVSLEARNQGNLKIGPLLKMQDSVDSTNEITYVNALAGLEFSQSKAVFDSSRRVWVYTRVLNLRKIWDHFQAQAKDNRLNVQLIVSAESGVDRGLSDKVIRAFTLIRPAPVVSEATESEKKNEG